MIQKNQYQRPKLEIQQKIKKFFLEDFGVSHDLIPILEAELINKRSEPM